MSTVTGTSGSVNFGEVNLTATPGNLVFNQVSLTVVFGNVTGSYLDDIDDGTTTTPAAALSLAARVVLAVVLTVVVVVGVLGNSVVCVLVYRKAAMRSAINLLVAQLALSDFLFSVLVMPSALAGLFLLPAAADNRGWGRRLCASVAFLHEVLVTLNVCVLLAISLDRYLIIVHRKEKLNVRRARIFIALAWGYSFLASVGPLVGWGRPASYPGHPLCPDLLARRAAELSYVAVGCLVTKYLPLAAILYSYACILSMVRRKSMKVHHYSVDIGAARGGGARSALPPRPQPRISVTGALRDLCLPDQRGISVGSVSGGDDGVLRYLGSPERRFGPSDSVSRHDSVRGLCCHENWVKSPAADSVTGHGALRDLCAPENRFSRTGAVEGAPREFTLLEHLSASCALSCPACAESGSSSTSSGVSSLNSASPVCFVTSNSSVYLHSTCHLKLDRHSSRPSRSAPSWARSGTSVVSRGGLALTPVAQPLTVSGAAADCLGGVLRRNPATSSSSSSSSSCFFPASFSSTASRNAVRRTPSCLSSPSGFSPTAHGARRSANARRQVLDISFRTRTFKTILILSLLLCVCWLPYVTAVLVTNLTGRHLPASLCLLLWLGFVKSALNPVVYCLRIRKFRDACKDALPCSCCSCGFPRCVAVVAKRRVNPSAVYQCAESSQS